MSMQALTFVFTDIEGSTSLVRRIGDEGWLEVMSLHNDVLREVWDAHGGEEFGTAGDSFHVVFSSQPAALEACLAAQSELHRRRFPHDALVRVRIGAHTGEARRLGADILGLAVHQAARVSSAAHGGQVVVSETVAAGINGSLPPEAELLPLGAHRLKDFPDAVELFQLSHPKLPAHFPPLRTRAVVPTNLQRSRTPIIGRTDEITEITKLLSSSRLVTMLGPGGIGKTRLAQAVGWEMIDDRPDGVWMCELAAVNEGPSVPEAVCKALGLRVEGDPFEVLASSLDGREAVLILDNAEHVVAAVADLCDRLLDATGELVVLVTSRERLGVVGEQEFKVPSLSITTDAMQLFVQRAAQVKPFDLDPANAADVERICGQLEGLPLAIELAAVRTRTMTPAQIANKLSDQLTSLGSGPRTSPDRHRTMDAAVAWSYDLLSDDERTAFTRCSVFRGGFDHESAEAVIGAPPLEAGSVPSLIEELCAKSLLQSDGGRISMLEPIRQFAARLLTGPELDEVMNRCVRYFTELVERAEPKLSTGEQLEWLARLDDDADNVRAAFEAALAGEDATVPLRIALAMNRYFALRGMFADSLRLIERTALDVGPPEMQARALLIRAYGVEQPAPDAEELLGKAEKLFESAGDRSGLVSVLVDRSSNASWTKDTDAATRLATEALELARTGSDARWLQEALVRVARCALWDRSFDTLRSACGELLELAAESGDRAYIVIGHSLLSDEARARGDLPGASEHLEYALSAARELGDPSRIAWALGRLGHIALARQQRAAARRAWEEAMALFTDLGNKEGIVACLMDLSDLHTWEGDHISARALREDALAIQREIGGANVAWVLGGLAFSLSACGEHDAAIDRCNEAIALCRSAGDMHGLGWNLQRLVDILDTAGRTAEAKQRLAETMEIARQVGGEVLVRCFTATGILAVLDGDKELAYASWEEGQRIVREQGRSRAEPELVAELAQLHLAEGNLDRAEELFTEALESGRADDVTPEVACCLGHLGDIALRRGDRSGLQLMIEAYEMFVDINGGSWSTMVLPAVARIAAAAGDLASAARLMGYAIGEDQSKSLHYDRMQWSFRQSQLDDLVGSVRAAMEPGDFDREWSAGMAMTLLESDSLALEVLRAADESLPQDLGVLVRADNGADRRTVANEADRTR